MVEHHINVEAKPGEIMEIHIEQNEDIERVLEYNNRLSAIEANEDLSKSVERIACKYVKLVEERIDSARCGLVGQDLRDIYDGVQLLGNIVSTLERLSRMK